MPSPLITELELLYEALAAEWGIAVTATDLDLAVTRLHKAKRSDPMLSVIQIRRVDEEIWITRGRGKDKELG